MPGYPFALPDPRNLAQLKLTPKSRLSLDLFFVPLVG